MSDGMVETQPTVFADLSADDVEQRPMEIESLCMQCHENGITRLMCTRIPYYRQVIIVSFSCEHCGHRNNELQSGEAAQEHGTEIVLTAKLPEDLNRQIVKSEYAQLEIPELELVIPHKSQTGEITTVEGVLTRVKSGLLQNQELRRIQNPEGAEKIDRFIEKMDACLELKTPFTLKLTDPSGNCYIQSPDPLHVDPRCITSHYCRRLADRKLLGFADDDEVEDENEAPEWRSYEDAKHEVLRFKTDCPSCGAPCETLMKPTDIPYFQTVIIMSTSCDVCGNKSNEVKSGGSIKEYGCKTTVTIKEVSNHHI
uniref:Zpr1 domain-containing protein n=1 Tax=Steinernema glaseri TaxID=37863 RepID=A0A1I7YZN6_9BILA